MPDADANADSERMQILLRRFEIPLLQFATRITGDRERAHDVVQETFVNFTTTVPFRIRSLRPGFLPFAGTGRSMFAAKRDGCSTSMKN
jgi:Sigma-70 region 2